MGYNTDCDDELDAANIHLDSAMEALGRAVADQSGLAEYHLAARQSVYEAISKLADLINIMPRR